jgi:hypothetical protein
MDIRDSNGGLSGGGGRKENSDLLSVGMGYMILGWRVLFWRKRKIATPIAMTSGIPSPAPTPIKAPRVYIPELAAVAVDDA